LSFLLEYPEEIQEKEGIYFWNYYPVFDALHSDYIEIRKVLEKYSRTNISLSEVAEQFKYRVEVGECAFPNNSRLFGLSEEKEEKFVNFLKSNQNNITLFHDFFKDACLRRPFYVGKALNLRNRLKQHFQGRSEILQILFEKKVSYNDIWIGLQETNFDFEESISNIFEEIIQRITKPGLTQRPG